MISYKVTLILLVVLGLLVLVRSTIRSVRAEMDQAEHNGEV